MTIVIFKMTAQRRFLEHGAKILYEFWSILQRQFDFFLRLHDRVKYGCFYLFFSRGKCIAKSSVGKSCLPRDKILHDSQSIFAACSTAFSAPQF